MPPDKETPQGRHSPRDATATSRLKEAGTADSNGRQWRRRRAASRRLPVLDCRCSTADPWLCRCGRPLLSEQREADAYRDTVLHLRGCGLLAAPNIPAMQVLRRRSPEDRRLVAEIAERWELAG